MRSNRKPPTLPDLDFRSGLPAYLQIVRQVQRYAARGRLRAGDRLPTVRGLAARLGVNFNTVARAYRLLERMGLVSAQAGRGTFLSAPSSHPAARAATLDVLTAQYIAAARGHDFPAAQIQAALARQLKRELRTRRTGDDFE